MHHIHVIKCISDALYMWHLVMYLKTLHRKKGRTDEYELVPMFHCMHENTRLRIMLQFIRCFCYFYQFLLIFRKAAAGELKSSGLNEVYRQMHEIDVDKEGVKGAKNFFEAKVCGLIEIYLNCRNRK